MGYARSTIHDPQSMPLSSFSGILWRSIYSVQMFGGSFCESIFFMCIFEMIRRDSGDHEMIQRERGFRCKKWGKDFVPISTIQTNSIEICSKIKMIFQHIYGFKRRITVTYFKPHTEHISPEIVVTFWFPLNKLWMRMINNN